MGVAIETARRETSGWKIYVLALYYFVARNVAISAAVFGVLQIGLGLLIHVRVGSDEGNISILAGFFGVWGATLVVLGLATYGAFWANKLYGQRVLDEQ